MTMLQDAADMARDPRLLPPLTIAVVTAALNVINEGQEAPDHAPRAELAHRVLVEPYGYAQRFAWAVATNTTVAAKWAAEDIDGAIGDLQFVTDSVWNAFAGIDGD